MAFSPAATPYVLLRKFSSYNETFQTFSPVQLDFWNLPLTCQILHSYKLPCQSHWLNRLLILWARLIIIVKGPTHQPSNLCITAIVCSKVGDEWFGWLNQHFGLVDAPGVLYMVPHQPVVFNFYILFKSHQACYVCLQAIKAYGLGKIPDPSQVMMTCTHVKWVTHLSYAVGHWIPWPC